MSERQSLFDALRRYGSRATGLLAGTGVGRTTRKADTGGGFHPATAPIQPYTEDDYEGFVLTCTWCSGEGEFWGSELPGYDPGWHDPDTVYACPACHGTGERRDQVLF